MIDSLLFSRRSFYCSQIIKQSFYHTEKPNKPLKFNSRHVTVFSVLSSESDLTKKIARWFIISLTTGHIHRLQNERDLFELDHGKKCNPMKWKWTYLLNWKTFCYPLFKLLLLYLSSFSKPIHLLCYVVFFLLFQQ